MSERAGLDVKIDEAHGLCPVTWPASGSWFPHACGRSVGHEGRHTCGVCQCRSWRKPDEGGDDEDGS